MSCISEILKLKGDAEFLKIPDSRLVYDVVVEGGGVYRHYEYLITFTNMGHRCGYVAINPDHPVYGADEVRQDSFELEVHGGITFQGNHHLKDIFLKTPCLDEWLGFDAAHWYDFPCIETVEKYWGKSKKTEMQKEVHSSDSSFDFTGEERSHKTYQYMEQQCKNLIDQLINIKISA